MKISVLSADHRERLTGEWRNLDSLLQGDCRARPLPVAAALVRNVCRRKCPQSLGHPDRPGQDPLRASLPARTDPEYCTTHAGHIHRRQTRHRRSDGDRNPDMDRTHCRVARARGCARREFGLLVRSSRPARHFAGWLSGRWGVANRSGQTRGRGRHCRYDRVPYDVLRLRRRTITSTDACGTLGP